MDKPQYPMTLTFKDAPKSKLVAMIEGGKYNGKRIYINNDGTTTGIPLLDPFIILTESWFKSKKKNMSRLEMIRLEHAIRYKRPPEDEELFNIYEEATKLLDDRISKEIYLTEGKIKPMARIADTIRAYICGATGSGKSTWAANFIRNLLHHNSNKKYKIVVFSVLTDDEVIDKLEPLRINIDENLLKHPIILDELTNSIVIFDDIETFSNKKIRDCIANLRDQCLSEGRHHGISTICTNHQITDYKKTRNMILECEFITFFPQSGGNNSIIRLLKNYVGLDKRGIQRIMNLPSRWVTIFNRYPISCLYEHGIYITNNTNILV